MSAEVLFKRDSMITVHQKSRALAGLMYAIALSESAVNNGTYANTTDTSTTSSIAAKHLDRLRSVAEADRPGSDDHTKQLLQLASVCYQVPKVLLQQLFKSHNWSPAAVIPIVSFLFLTAPGCQPHPRFVDLF